MTVLENLENLRSLGLPREATGLKNSRSNGSGPGPISEGCS